MENHAIMRILSLEFIQVSNRKISGLFDPAFKHRSGFNELSRPLPWFSADSPHKNNGIDMWKILPCYSRNGTYHLTQCWNTVTYSKKAILWSSPLQDRSVLQTLTNYLPGTPEVEKKVLFYVYSWSLSQNSQKKPQILASHLRCLTTDFFSASKIYLQIKFPIIVSVLHIPYQIPVVRVSRKSVTICEKLWVQWLAQHYVWNEVK